MKFLLLLVGSLIYPSSDSDIVVSLNKENYCYGRNEIILNYYTIYNNSTENIYTWIDYSYDPNGNKQQSLSRYFYTTYDLRFIDLLTDNVVFENFSPTIGCTFLKIIEPNESFTYVGYNGDDFFNHIIYLKESDIISFLGISYNNINHEPLYKGPSIVVPVHPSQKTKKCSSRIKKRLKYNRVPGF